jgi:hypothetical protein
MYTPHISAASTLGVRKNMLSNQKCSTPTLGMDTKICLLGFHRINAPSTCKYLSLKKSLLQKEAWAMKKKKGKKEKY